MLARTVIVIIILFVGVLQAAVISVMRDESKKASDPKKAFHKSLIIWAVVNTAIVIVGFYIFTGTLLGWQL